MLPLQGERAGVRADVILASRMSGLHPKSPASRPVTHRKHRRTPICGLTLLRLRFISRRTCLEHGLARAPSWMLPSGVAV